MPVGDGATVRATSWLAQLAVWPCLWVPYTCFTEMMFYRRYDATMSEHAMCLRFTVTRPYSANRHQRWLREGWGDQHRSSPRLHGSYAHVGKMRAHTYG